MTLDSTSTPNLSIDGERFIVLTNHKNEFSLWPAEKIIPNGWENVGFTGSKDECKSYIDQHWLSMMPISGGAKKH